MTRLAGLVASLLLAAHVLWSHAVAWRAFPGEVEPPLLEHFGRAASFQAAFAASGDGFSTSLANGRLRIERAQPGRPFRWQATGPHRRHDRRRIDVRFRLDGPVELSIGVATSATRALSMGARAGEMSWIWTRSGGSPSTPLGPLPQPNEWHQLALVLDGTHRAALVELDGEPRGWIDMPWSSTEAAALVIAATTHGNGPATVDLGELSDLPLEQAGRAVDFVEHFGGAILDAARWQVQPFPTGEAEATLVTGPSGLSIRGRARSSVDSGAELRLTMPPSDLLSFRLSLRVTIRKLHHAGLFVGVDNGRGGRAWRAANLGIAHGPDGRFPFFVGHLAGETALAVTPSAPGPARTTSELVVEFDMRRQELRGTIDGRPLPARRVRLLPLEPASIQLGCSFAQSDAEFDLLVEEIRFQRMSSG